MMGDNLPSKKNFWFFFGFLEIFTHFSLFLLTLSFSFPSVFFYFLKYDCQKKPFFSSIFLFSR